MQYTQLLKFAQPFCNHEARVLSYRQLPCHFRLKMPYHLDTVYRGSKAVKDCRINSCTRKTTPPFVDALQMHTRCQRLQDARQKSAAQHCRMLHTCKAYVTNYMYQPTLGFVSQVVTAFNFDNFAASPLQEGPIKRHGVSIYCTSERGTKSRIAAAATGSCKIADGQVKTRLPARPCFNYAHISWFARRARPCLLRPRV